MATMEFKIENFDRIEDEMDGYTKVDTKDIVGKSFIIEKVQIRDDKNGHMMCLAFDLDGDKLFIYTGSKRLVRTIETVIKECGSIPLVPVKIVTEKYDNSPNPGYKFVSA